MTSVYEDSDPNNLGLSGDIGQVNQDELDFSYLFEYATCGDFPGEDKDESNLPSQKVLSPPSGLGYPHEDHQSCSRSPYRDPVPDGLPGYEHPDASRAGGPALSPRIEITPSHELYHHGRDTPQAQPVNIGVWPSLTVPGLEGVAYREAQCLSPASSNSSTSWHSESYSPWASPCVSPSGGGTAADLCPRFQNIHTCSPHTSPGTSPRTSVTEETYLGARSPSPRPGSRSTSPQGKRTYDMYQNPSLAPRVRSRSPSPHGGRDDQHRPPAPAQYGPPAGLAEAVNGLGAGLGGSVPTKIVKSNLDYQAYGESQPDSFLFSCEQDVKGKTESFYVIPQIWPNQLVPSLCSIPVASLPSLEWPVPSQNDQYELRIEVQPKPHHRAHYETEGSRGAVKSPSGGHPVVQLHGYQGKETLGLQIFIGTADERILKPHAFYQVHRITGKTVTTTSYEKIVHSTKILELPLEPKNNMRAVIDCAGILKLRNADIELRKGETDIGRKNTRVRLVFRVHIPQPGGQYLSLQVASHPIECSQRSAHELPMVEKQDMDRCSVLGGQQMILTGQNFTSESKVVFSEKTHDGQQIWDVEASVDKDKSQANMLFVEVPRYRDPSICRPAKVNFYVINGKRKRSQPQHFTYTPLPVTSIKTERVDDYQSSQMGYAVSQVLGASPQSYYHNLHGLVNQNSGLLGSMGPACELSGPDSRYQPQNPAIIYPWGAKTLGGSPLLFQQLGGGTPEGHQAALVHPASQAEPRLAGTTQLSVSPRQHSSSSSTALHVSPTNHLLQGAASLPGQQPLPYCDDGFPSARSAAHPLAAYHGVIHPQPHPVPKVPRPPPGQADPQRGPSARVTIKQENLDQVYLDDANKNRLFCS
ncbi:nuclear factor of activated T-cells, cytoplasmic 2-like isoform X2 [Anguilla anguilla]|uniref:nuclear factor of activated T-cells, cytoplasmic 2-like isoform X2 n=1 Tax=Anguilla anguilla TaxID=7936 RepID=UPI0015B178EC|nr:nuclear factor of activated T-cells, cytoplasmic 2-like isoform X2 [Anguilla anguilla]